MSGLYEVQRERGTFIRVLGGSRILWTLWQSQPGLCFRGWMWLCLLTCQVTEQCKSCSRGLIGCDVVATLGQTQDWKDQWAGEQWAQDHVVLPGGKQTWLLSMKIRLNILLAYHWVPCFLGQAEIQTVKVWYLCTGTLGCSWHSYGGQHKSQSAGTASCIMDCLLRDCLLKSALVAASQYSLLRVHHI